MNCTNCGAPLTPGSYLCPYCKTLNEVDLRAVRKPVHRGEATERLCPHCGVRLQAVHVKADGGFVVDQCKECFGIFFDPGEVEAMLEAAVAHVYEIDFQRLSALTEGPRPQVSRPVQYISCPDCGQLMNRKNYGSRSGVIVDECRNHGIWLDSGELLELFKWVKAGGRKYDERRKAQEAEKEARAQRRAASERAFEGVGGYSDGDPCYDFAGSPLAGLVRLLWRALS